MSGFGKSAFGVSYRHEQIMSNVLGLPMPNPISVKGESEAYFLKKDDRNNLSFFIEHSFYAKKWNISAGLLSNYNSVFDWHWIPGFDLSYQFTEKLRFFASMNKSFRLPTYTDLYYVGPTNIGNPELKAEEALAYEAGFKYINDKMATEIAYFNRYGKNIIDWVRLSDSLKWESKNITQLTTNGIEFLFLLNSKFFGELKIPIQKLKFSYAYIDVVKRSGEYLSKYALDYLKHKVTFGFSHPINKHININWQATYQDRAGTYYNFENKQETDYTPFVLIDSKINWEIKNWNVYLEMANIFNVSYFDIGNVVMPGRWVRFGLSTNLNFKKIIK